MAFNGTEITYTALMHYKSAESRQLTAGTLMRRSLWLRIL